MTIPQLFVDDSHTIQSLLQDTSSGTTASSIEEINFVGNVTYIGENAFNGTSLRVCTIPQSVTQIKSNSFYGCKLEGDLEISKNVKNIGDHAFYECNDIDKIIFEDGSEDLTIGSYSFTGEFTEVILPARLKSITDYSFMSDYIEKITIPQSAISYGVGDGTSWIEYEFYGSTDSLKEINFCGDITYIGVGAFRYLSKLESITIPNTVTKIYEGAFGNCSSLTTLSIPDSVTEIENDAFQYCTSLTDITFGSGLRTLGRTVFRDCTSLSSVSIPTSVTTISEYAFSDSGITDIYTNRADNGTLTGAPWGAGGATVHWLTNTP